ncbi:MAG: hypothetical protein Q4D79_03755 [Propionibacteriaceae bacterium]|nr:hypothetical protein [Propionibacteriaceae bacterium]
MTPPPIRRTDVLLAAFMAVAPATVMLAALSFSPRISPENLPRLQLAAALNIPQGLALLWWRRHPLICQAVAWLLDLASMLIAQQVIPW